MSIFHKITKYLFVILILIVAIASIGIDNQFMFKNQNTLKIDENEKYNFLDTDSKLYINYILPDFIYQNKYDLYNDFFTELYEYVINEHSPYGQTHLHKFNIDSLSDALNVCGKWEGGVQGMSTVGNAFGKYFAAQKHNTDFNYQKNTNTFVGYCMKNKKFVDFLYFAKTFFYHWRIDEGYTYTGPDSKGTDPYGSDFFSMPSASIIDIAKFFYFDKDNLPRYFYIEKNIPNLYDKIPGLLKSRFGKRAIFNYKANTNDEYILPYKFDCYGFEFDGWYFDEDFKGQKITKVTRDNIISFGPEITLYAKFHRTGVFADEINRDHILDD